MRLFSRPARAAVAVRRKLALTRLESRDTPSAAPAIEMTVTAIDATRVAIRGTVQDENPQDCLVNLGGVTAPISFVNPDGSFEIVAIQTGGDITGFAVDEEGQASRVYVPPFNANPEITEFQCGLEGGNAMFVQGRVVDEDPQTCTVFLTSSCPVLNNVTVTVDLDGYWSFIATKPPGFKGASVRAVATDQFGLQSAPQDGYVPG